MSIEVEMEFHTIQVVGCTNVFKNPIVIRELDLRPKLNVRVCIGVSHCCSNIWVVGCINMFGYFCPLS